MRQRRLEPHDRIGYKVILVGAPDMLRHQPGRYPAVPPTCRA